MSVAYGIEGLLSQWTSAAAAKQWQDSRLSFRADSSVFTLRSAGLLCLWHRQFKLKPHTAILLHIIRQMGDQSNKVSGDGSPSPSSHERAACNVCGPVYICAQVAGDRGGAAAAFRQKWRNLGPTLEYGQHPAYCNPGPLSLHCSC